jgi:hypothetical protein
MDTSTNIESNVHLTELHTAKTCMPEPQRRHAPAFLVSIGADTLPDPAAKRGLLIEARMLL